MKRIFITLNLAIIFLLGNAQETQKVSAPLFTVDKVEIICCNSNFKDGKKKVHIVSAAGWSVFHDISVQIKDVNGTIIGTYGPMNQDYYTPCINMNGNAAYTVNIINSSNQIMIDNNFNNVPNETCTYSLTAPKCGTEKTIESAGPYKPVRPFFGAIHYTTFTPEIKVPGLGNIVDKAASGMDLSFEMALPNKTGKKRKLIPAIELGANYSKFSFNNGLSLMQQKYPPLSASESRMVNASKENKKGRIISVSIVPKFIVPIWRFNVSLGAGITYLNHTIPDVNVQDELVKTNSNQPLEYATSICCNHRGMFGGEFRMNLSYWLTNSIAVTGGAGYMAGPKNNAELNLLKATDSNNDKLFSVGELRNGTMQQAAYTYSLNAVKLNAGVIIALQRRHDYVGHVTLLR